MSPPQVDLTGLQTENRNPRSIRIDTAATPELCRIINREDAGVAKAVGACIPAIAQTIDILAERVRQGGRVFSIGAGTSGRLGVLDAVEIPPTYLAPARIFVSLIAGGDGALRQAKEGAEDDIHGAERDLTPYNLDPDVDTVFGIAASGRTPYVLGGLAWAKSIGCKTVGLVCVHPSDVEEEGNADFVIAPVTGPEVVAGSTRMKAGTATKLVLNMISTGIMIRLGKTFGNLMIDLKVTNHKLEQRARNILRSVIPKSEPRTDEELDDTLRQCHGSVKLAAAVIATGLSTEEATELLERQHGVLARVFEDVHTGHTGSFPEEQLVLCVDGGGSSCTAVILGKQADSGYPVSGEGSAGPCNVTTVGIDAAIAGISKAVQQAVDDLPVTTGTPFQSVPFTKIVVGLAGYGRPKLQPLIDQAVSDLFVRPLGPGLKVTTDVQLLPNVFPPDCGCSSVIALIAGTGSVAMKFSLADSEWVFSKRAGGWGPMLGDDSSGFGLGRMVLRMVLRQQEAQVTETPLISEVKEALKEEYPAHVGEDGEVDLVSALVSYFQSGNHATPTFDTTRRIADIGRIVVKAAEAGEQEAFELCREAVQGLAGYVTSLLDKDAEETCGIVFSGGLMKNEWLRGRVQKYINQTCGEAKLEYKWVDSPALLGAQQLEQDIKGE